MLAQWSFLCSLFFDISISERKALNFIRVLRFARAPRLIDDITGDLLIPSETLDFVRFMLYVIGPFVPRPCLRPCAAAHT